MFRACMSAGEVDEQMISVQNKNPSYVLDPQLHQDRPISATLSVAALAPKGTLLIFKVREEYPSHIMETFSYHPVAKSDRHSG